MQAPGTSGKTSRGLGLQGHLGMLAAAFIASTGLILALIGYLLVIAISDVNVKRHVNDLTTILKTELVHRVRQPVRPTLNALAQGFLEKSRTLEERLLLLPVLAAFMNNCPIIGSIMVGYEDGEFFAFHRLSVDDERRAYDTPPESSFLVVSFTAATGTMRREHLFYDGQMRLLLHREVAEGRPFDPRVRPWYQAAVSSAENTGSLVPW